MAVEDIESLPNEESQLLPNEAKQASSSVTSATASDTEDQDHDALSPSQINSYHVAGMLCLLLIGKPAAPRDRDKEEIDMIFRDIHRQRRWIHCPRDIRCHLIPIQGPGIRQLDRNQLHSGNLRSTASHREINRHLRPEASPPGLLCNLHRRRRYLRLGAVNVASLRRTSRVGNRRSGNGRRGIHSDHPARRGTRCRRVEKLCQRSCNDR